MKLKNFIKDMYSQAALGVDLDSDKNFNDNLIKYLEDDYKVHIIDLEKCYSYRQSESFIATLREKYPDPSNVIVVLTKKNYSDNSQYSSMLYMHLVNMNYKIIIDANIVSSQSEPVQNRVITLSKDQVFSMMAPELELDKSSIINKINATKENLSPPSSIVNKP